MSPKPEPEWTTVARVLTTHGRHGELSAELLTDFPDRFQPGCRLWLSGGGASLQDFELEARRFHKGRILLKLRGMDTLSQAERWRGSLVQVPRSERRILSPEKVYLSDLVGCRVLDADRCLGIITGWEETGAGILLEVRAAEGEILIPFAEGICAAPDFQKKEIRVSLPEGLEGLNREVARDRKGPKARTR